MHEHAGSILTEGRLDGGCQSVSCGRQPGSEGTGGFFKEQAGFSDKRRRQPQRQHLSDSEPPAGPVVCTPN